MRRGRSEVRAQCGVGTSEHEFAICIILVVINIPRESSRYAQRSCLYVWEFTSSIPCAVMCRCLIFCPLRWGSVQSSRM